MAGYDESEGDLKDTELLWTLCVKTHNRVDVLSKDIDTLENTLGFKLGNLTSKDEEIEKSLSEQINIQDKKTENLKKDFEEYKDRTKKTNKNQKKKFNSKLDKFLKTIGDQIENKISQHIQNFE
jgi:molecular chaperone GrpE (heat shock protein)